MKLKPSVLKYEEESYGVVRNSTGMGGSNSLFNKLAGTPKIRRLRVLGLHTGNAGKTHTFIPRREFA